MSVAKGSEIRVADHFPKVLKQCKDVAEPFFRCFSDKTVEPGSDVSGRDPSSCAGRDNLVLASQGAVALTECQDLMHKYDECMAAGLNGSSTVIYRVPEAYRDR
jgi:hypothetical protein